MGRRKKDIDPNQFSERLRESMERKHINQKQLAKQVGLNVKSVNRYSNGATVPAVAMIECLSAALNISSEYLTGEIDTPIKLNVTEDQERKLSRISKGLNWLTSLGYRFEVEDYENIQIQETERTVLPSKGKVNKTLKKINVQEPTSIRITTPDESSSIVCDDEELTALIDEWFDYFQFRIKEIEKE